MILRRQLNTPVIAKTTGKWSQRSAGAGILHHTVIPSRLNACKLGQQQCRAGERRGAFQHLPVIWWRYTAATPLAKSHTWTSACDKDQIKWSKGEMHSPSFSVSSFLFSSFWQTLRCLVISSASPLCLPVTSKYQNGRHKPVKSTGVIKWACLKSIFYMLHHNLS